MNTYSDPSKTTTTTSKSSVNVTTTRTASRNNRWSLVSIIVTIMFALRCYNSRSSMVMAWRMSTATPRSRCLPARGFITAIHPKSTGLPLDGQRQAHWRRTTSSLLHSSASTSRSAAAMAAPITEIEPPAEQLPLPLITAPPTLDTNHNITHNQKEQQETASPPPLFTVTAPFPPAGDQPAAIQQLVQQVQNSKNNNNSQQHFSILRGITGTGKTLVMSHVIAQTAQPTLVLCHTKTLAAQLARELRSYLQPHAVELFVSYYNMYRPEFYRETTGTYMAKKSSINADLDALRHRATRALVTRRDVVIVASVSAIYGLGLPKEYLEASTELVPGETVFAAWYEFVERLEQVMLYECNDGSGDKDGGGSVFDRGQYQVYDLQDTKIVTLWPPHDQFPMQIELRRCSSSSSGSSSNSSRDQQQQQDDDDPDDSSSFVVHAIRRGTSQGFVPETCIRLFPARHHVVNPDRLEQACQSIEEELQDRVKELTTQKEKKLVEAERLQARVVTDLQLLREMGFCKGIENYSRYFAGRQAGEAPETLLDYFGLMFGKDWLLLMDESHVTLPQLRSMYAGDRARKRMLVKHGYRLPSALDNRPLRDDEFWAKVAKTVFVSATPSRQELEWSTEEPVDMVIRPTFVCDPEIEVRPSKEQLQDLLMEVKKRATIGEKTLAITLTKRDSEDLASFLQQNGVNSTYLHSGLSTPERSDALRSLQTGEIDCLVGVNCLREGIDLPQVSLVAVLNTDCEGFLRSDTALLQVVGRAARNTNGRAIFYADRVTDSMQRCIETTSSRRQKQLEFNRQNGCEMVSTKGSSVMSFFDLLKDQIKNEQKLEIVGHSQTDPNSPSTEESSKILREPIKSSPEGSFVETDHIPSSPGVYFWKNEAGDNLYIGKAANLRSRVKSYLTPGAKHGKRIKTMLERAVAVDILITPSERDALVLESKLIKHHQPRYNVLLKDDEHYPYICASVGDQIPRLSVVPYRQDTSAASKCNRYFGPYTSFKEINNILDTVEEQYGLRANAFLARHGDLPKDEYKELFKNMLAKVFDGGARGTDKNLSRIRHQYEEAGLLFDSEYNQSRDIVTVLPTEDDSSQTEAIVSVLQLRDGLVAGHFAYSCEVPSGFHCDQDYASAAMTVLSDRHYPAGIETHTGGFSWFPKAVLTSHPPSDAKLLKDIVRRGRDMEKKKGRVSVKGGASSGKKRLVDNRALEFALENARLVAKEKRFEGSGPSRALLDGSAASDLARLLDLENSPARIECYDISHTQGEFSVGSRVVFENGRPVPSLYRSFNVKTVDGVDDYASLQEVLERRFKRAWVNGVGCPVAPSDPWALPDLVVVDGGKGQLSAAVDALSRVSIVPTGCQPAEAPFSGEGRIASVALCAIAKNEEQIFVHGQKDPVNDRPDSPAVLLLRALRDESHRFALNRHRRRRSLTVNSGQ